MQQELLQAHFDKLFDQVLQSLLSDPARTFTHYEVKYFSNWFYRQNDQT